MKGDDGHSAPPRRMPTVAAETETTSIPSPFTAVAVSRPLRASLTVSKLAVLKVV